MDNYFVHVRSAVLDGQDYLHVGDLEMFLRAQRDRAAHGEMKVNQEGFITALIDALKEGRER